MRDLLIEAYNVLEGIQTETGETIDDLAGHVVVGETDTLLFRIQTELGL